MEVVLSKEILFITAIPMFIIFKAIKLIKCKDIDMTEELIKNLFVVYLIMMIDATIFPIVVYRDGSYTQIAASIYERANVYLIPFTNSIREGLLIENGLGNILLLMPLIMFIFALNKNNRNIKYCIKLSLSVSLLIKCTQLTLNILTLSVPAKVVALEDVIFNVMGAVIAYYICDYFMKKYKLKKERIQQITQKPKIQDI